jgi:uncharacterized membrane protein
MVCVIAVKISRMFSLLLILRLLHILAGVIWAVIAFHNAFFALPAATGFGPDGEKLVRQVPLTTPFQKNVLTAVSTITILTGMGLILISLGGFSLSWFLTLHGNILLFAAGCALAAYGIVVVINRIKDSKGIMDRLHSKVDIQRMNKSF